MKRLIVFTVLDDTTIQFRQYEVPQITEPHVQKGQLDLREIGPSFDLKLRRTQLASIDLYKTACRKPKITNIDKKRVNTLNLTFLSQRRMFTPLKLETKEQEYLSKIKTLKYLLQESSKHRDQKRYRLKMCERMLILLN